MMSVFTDRRCPAVTWPRRGVGGALVGGGGGDGCGGPAGRPCRQLVSGHVRGRFACRAVVDVPFSALRSRRRRCDRDAPTPPNRRVSRRAVSRRPRAGQPCRPPAASRPWPPSPWPFSQRWPHPPPSKVSVPFSRPFVGRHISGAERKMLPLVVGEKNCVHGTINNVKKKPGPLQIPDTPGLFTGPLRAPDHTARTRPRRRWSWTSSNGCCVTSEKNLFPFSLHSIANVPTCVAPVFAPRIFVLFF